MQVVSGPLGFEQVHFEAPVATRIGKEMKEFLEWFNSDNILEWILKSAVAHLYFITIHPFDDGNGRIARAISDLCLAKADNSSMRFYSISSQILKDRKNYYDILENTQKGGLDITTWLVWYLNCVLESINQATTTLASVRFKAKFWERFTQLPLNERQIKILNLLLDDFYGKLTSSKYAKICKCSQDTANRDINQLLKQDVLIKNEGGGRNTSYSLNREQIS